MKVLHKTVNLREENIFNISTGGSYKANIQKALNKYGADGWALQNVVDDCILVFTKEVTDEEFDEATEEELETTAASDEDSDDDSDEDDDSDDDDDEDEDEKDLEDMTKPELLVYARDHEIDVNPNHNKSAILESIQEQEDDEE